VQSTGATMLMLFWPTAYDISMVQLRHKFYDFSLEESCLEIFRETKQIV